MTARTMVLRLTEGVEAVLRKREQDPVRIELRLAQIGNYPHERRAKFIALSFNSATQAGSRVAVTTFSEEELVRKDQR